MKGEESGSNMGPSQVFAWLGNEKNRARLQRRFFRFFLPSYRVLALGLGILCLVNLGTHWEREEQGKDERGSDFAHDVGRQIAEGEKGGWSFHSHRRLTSSVLGSEPLTGKSMAASLSIFPRTLPPKPTQNLRPLTQVRTLRFQTCNGFANQRLSLAYGVILAKLTNRVPVLPDFLLNGLQRSDKWVTDAGSNGSLPMPDVYDVQAFREGLSRVGMEILTPEEAPPISVYLELTLENVTDAVSHIERKHDLHVQIDCPFLRLPKEVVKANEDVFWAVLESLEPTKKYVSIVDEAVRRLTELGLQSAEKAPATLQEAERRIQSGGGFSFLHLRLENDWLAHCKRWERIQDGRVRNNCLQNTWDVHEALLAKRVSPKQPLYVASMWSDTDPANKELVLGALEGAGYKVFTHDDVLPDLEVPLSREENALIDFYIALAADKFIGNSVSSFSALLIYERSHAGKWAGYYNGGNIPLDDFLPALRLPWVFTYNDWSEKYDYMIKAAVRSANRFDTLAPYCLYSGNRTADIHQWLVAQNVRMVYHNPLWATQIARLLEKKNLGTSHLYANPEMAVGTWQRIDIPIVPELEQFEYVLFTDSDVFFRRSLTLSDFGLPLPPTIGMASEAMDIFPYNAGIMLMNLPRLRLTYEKFLSFVLGNKNGLFFTNYGPQDQGAYNQFYEREIKHTKLGQEYNAKPYHAHRESAYIVHFHGPKPHVYSEFFRTGDCPFRFSDETEVVNTLCELGVKRAYCTYIQEWSKFSEKEDVVDSTFNPACSLEIKVLTKVARRIAW